MRHASDQSVDTARLMREGADLAVQLADRLQAWAACGLTNAVHKHCGLISVATIASGVKDAAKKQPRPTAGAFSQSVLY